MSRIDRIAPDFSKRPQIHQRHSLSFRGGQHIVQLIQAPLSREQKLSSFPILCGVDVSFETLPVNPALCFIPRIYRRHVVPGVIQPLALRTSSNSLLRHLYHNHSLTHTVFFSMTMPLQTTFMHFLDISPTFAITLILSFLILSSLVTPLIHLNTFISATYCDFFTAHVH